MCVYIYMSIGFRVSQTEESPSGIIYGLYTYMICKIPNHLSKEPLASRQQQHVASSPREQVNRIAKLKRKRRLLIGLGPHPLIVVY